MMENINERALSNRHCQRVEKIRSGLLPNCTREHFVCKITGNKKSILYIVFFLKYGISLKIRELSWRVG